MTRVVVLPHRTAATGVTPEPWTVVVRGSSRLADELVDGVVEGWDVQTPLELQCTVDVDPAEVRRDCGLPEHAGLALAVLWHADGTNVRRVGAHVALGESATYPVRVVVPPDLVGGRLRVARLVVLTGGGDAPPVPAVAHRPGDVVWREPRRSALALTLHAAGDRFPTEAVDFTQLPGAAPGAAWWLTARLDDLDGQPAHALRLFVNSAHPAVEHLLGGGDDADAARTASVLRWDVARSLVDRALDEAAFVEGFGSFRPGTVGGALQRLFQRWLPGASPAELLERRTIDRGSYESELQARLTLLAEPS